MADSAGEKTEKATPKKRRDERKEGNVFQSKEVVIAATLLAVFFGFKLLYPITQNAAISSLKEFFSLVATKSTIKTEDAMNFLISGIKAVALGCIPILLVCSLVAIIATIAQTRALVNFKSLKPKFSRLNPISGFKKMFSLKGVIELLKSIIKITILFVVIYNTIGDCINTIAQMMDMTILQGAAATAEMCMDIITSLSIAFVALAFFDFLYQRWDYEKNLRMTKQEVKEEYKMTEGDPQIKGKIKQRQQAMARRRMMQAVPEADVIIRNPTHYAVALKYDSEKNRAPIVVAKGADNLALKIIEIGQNHGVMITENRPLARALYAQVDVDREIPAEFYQAVAEVLAVLYRLREKELK
ncbi:MAG: flagellar biosynthesis protein FlhB [Oscillospiraceae bacterium]|nr:flagellar biosynthesis protein FlhB [Oscillospiraceae bacterium]